MAKIGLIVDEGADLPQNIIKKYKISIVPFKVDLGEMKDIPGNIYQKIKEAEKRGLKSFVKTSQPSVGDFLSAFKEKFKKFEEIICITITSKLSGTFNSAIQAKKFLGKELQEKVSVVDSLSGSSGEGLLVVRAAKLIEKGLEFKEILDNLKKAVSKTHLIFMLQDPKWLESSGRIPRILTLWIRQMQKFGIRPLLGAKNGLIKPIGIKKGVKDLATALFKDFETKISKIKNKKIHVAITHADNWEEAKKLKELVNKIENAEIVFISLIGNILGGLAGPGALTLGWQE